MWMSRLRRSRATTARLRGCAAVRLRFTALTAPDTDLRKDLVVHILVPSLLTATMMTALSLVLVPPFLTRANAVFSPTQLDAIAVKERARTAAVSALVPAQYGDDPSGLFGAYSTRLGTYDPTDPGKEGTRTDSVNMFFGGLGSSWDVWWDMTAAETYTTGYRTTNGWAVPDDEGNGRWGDESCSNPQNLRIGSGSGAVERPTAREVVTREDCTTGFEDDISRFHMRIWDGGFDATHGSWSVGTAHWDPDYDHGCGSFLFEEGERNVVEAFTADDGTPLWFVGDIWQFPVLDDTTVPLRSPNTPEVALDECILNEAAPPSVMHYEYTPSGTAVEVPQPVPSVPNDGTCPNCPGSNLGLNVNPGGDGWGSDQPDGVAHYILLVA